MNSKSLLIIDDEKKLCDLLARILELEGYTVYKAYTGKEGLSILGQQNISVVLCDVKLPDYNGIDLVALIKQLKPFVQVINLTAYGTIADSVVAMKNGAYDYMTKGDDNDKIIPLVAKAFEAAEIAARSLSSPKPSSNGFDEVIGKSKVMLDLVAMAKKVAHTEANVLLLGETGTGKEVFAKAIHQSSAHAKREFMAINCSAISAELLESELFGFKKGAFTGALQDKKGLLEQADGGTLFLDEIGDMPLHMQAKILRVLEDGTFIKIGDLQSKKVSIRIIAATHKNLLEEVEKGNFREDLYYRLAVFTLLLPKLNDRGDDVVLLANHFIKRFGAAIPMSESFKTALLKHQWKGNIRELKNTIERSLILNEEPVLDIALLPSNFNSTPVGSAVDLEMASVEEQHIRKVLQHTTGNKSEAAKLLGIGLATLYRKMEQYGIAKY